MRLLLSVLLIVLPACARDRNDPPNRTAFTPVMPDASFRGWTRMPVPPDRPLDPISQWKIDAARKVLVCEGNRGHEWLRYDRELADFLLHVEWRFTPIEGGKGYNSGVYVRNSADGSIWHQAQTGDASGGYLFGNTPVNGTPQRINLRPQMTEMRVRPAGEWNVYDIRCQGKTIALSVNGKPTSIFTECAVPKGYMGLEAEGYRIEFRNLRVRELRGR